MVKIILSQIELSELLNSMREIVREEIAASAAINMSEHLPKVDRLLTISEAAKLLSLSVATLYGLVHSAKIPVSKQGKRLYFSEQELFFWVKTGRKKTITEIDADANKYLQKRR